MTYRGIISMVCILTATLSTGGVDPVARPVRPGSLPFYYDLYTFRDDGTRTKVVAAIAVPRYAEWNGGVRQNPGSVGKLLVALAIFQALADAWPDDIPARERVLRETLEAYFPVRAPWERAESVSGREAVASSEDAPRAAPDVRIPG